MDKLALETVFSIAICRQSGDKCHSKTLFQMIFYLGSSIVLRVSIAAGTLACDPKTVSSLYTYNFKLVLVVISLRPFHSSPWRV